MSLKGKVKTKERDLLIQESIVRKEVTNSLELQVYYRAEESTGLKAPIQKLEEASTAIKKS